MLSLNKTFLIGFVGKNPEVKEVNNTKVAKFQIATTKKYKSGDELKEKTTWFNIEAWGNLAKIVEDYVKEGTALHIEAEFENNNYEKDGKTVYGYVFKASSINILSPIKVEAEV